MIRKISIAKNPCEAVKTAPYPAAIAGASVGIFSVAAAITHEINEKYTDPAIAVQISEAVGLTTPALLLFGAIGYMNQQVKARNKVASHVEREGFNAEDYEKTVTTWCDRQRMLATLESPDDRQAYQQLCDQSKGQQQFPNLPHPFIED